MYISMYIIYVYVYIDLVTNEYSKYAQHIFDLSIFFSKCNKKKRSYSVYFVGKRIKSGQWKWLKFNRIQLQKIKLILVSLDLEKKI